jgi:hypothetical protein
MAFKIDDDVVAGLRDDVGRSIGTRANGENTLNAVFRQTTQSISALRIGSGVGHDSVHDRLPPDPRPGERSSCGARSLVHDATDMTKLR